MLRRQPSKRAFRSLRHEPLELRQLLHAGPIDVLTIDTPTVDTPTLNGGLVDVGEGESAMMVPDFQLEDVNASSATSGQLVSPRDYLGQVSGWYFGHAT